jgi:hypothetical protein
MIKYVAISTLSLASAASMALPVLALPSDAGTEVESLLGSPVAQLPINDPVLQKALELLQDNSAHKTPSKKNTPDSPIGRAPRHGNNRQLILGGPEVIPM